MLFSLSQNLPFLNYSGLLLTNLGVLICHFQVINVSDKNFYRRLKLIAILKYKKTEIATAVGSNCLRTRTCLLTHATI